MGLLLVAALTTSIDAFVCPSKSVITTTTAFLAGADKNMHNKIMQNNFPLYLSQENESSSTGVVELADDDEDEAPTTTPQAQAQAPFLSQGEVLPESLDPDLSDPKQTRVIIYTIISLLPVLFLIPLMLGSRDLIPVDSLPPVEL